MAVDTVNRFGLPASGVVHEINNPLEIMAGYLCRRAVDENTTELDKEVDHIKEIISIFSGNRGGETNMGLGLSIIYGIVTKHGGVVSAHNLEPAGTEFRVELPIFDESE